MSDDKMKRLRAPNITEEEKAIILYCIFKEKHIDECKKTDKFNNKEKNDAWERITLSFNSNQSVNKRDTKCLRRFWEGEKSKSRQGFVIERQARMLTGGGPETTSYLDITPEVNEIIQTRIDPQIYEIQNIYDGDGIEFTTEELSPLNDSVVYLSESHINDNPGE
ncbi:myb/SANT-like DNA-binding domain-containing protein 3 [Aphis gossypii]|uniref:myb/SANT-like DNA-binding domain-containing protein 3 n=1 Tax=Aphis gossypii TaxID=80765 RepID=UPI002158C02F|nr:myb/SANT-like DNA-binding domain-containing protein 3 [Aphis gossypii]